jgi:hypothetical protein
MIVGGTLVVLGVAAALLSRVERHEAYPSVAAFHSVAAAVAPFEYSMASLSMPGAGSSMTHERRWRTGSDTLPQSVRALSNAGAMLIRNARLMIRVDSLEPAIARVHAIAERLSGYVSGTERNIRRSEVRTASISLKIPAASLDEAISGIRPLGDLESVNISTTDVAEEFVDTDARMENARRLERRLTQILANRTGALKDVLEVEQALARVREEIERYEGRLRYLRDHVTMSEVAIYLHEAAPLFNAADGGVMTGALEQAWSNFVWFAVVVVQALGFVLPLGMLATLGWFLVRRWRPAESVAK